MGSKILGLFFVRSHTFKCSLDHAKRLFYRAVNGIFGRIGRTASEEVILELIKSKCLPILLYGLEACPLNNTSLRSLDFSVNRFFMVALCNRADYYVFMLWFVLLSFFFFLSFFSSPNLSGRRLDVYHTLAHGVALVRI